MRSTTQDWHLTPAEAAAVGADWLGLPHAEVNARLLYGEYDQNFRLETGSGERFVLKFMRGADAETRDLVDLQVAILHRLAAANLEIECPEPISCAGAPGAPFSRVLPDAVGGEHVVWVLSYVEGTLLDEVETYGDELLVGLGRGVAEVDRALLGLDAPQARRDLEWDLPNVERTRSLAHLVIDRDRRMLLESLHDRVSREVLPALASRPRSLIHNDGGNQHNMIVRANQGATSPDHRVAGIIDFGDAVETHRICGLGIAGAYATLGRVDPVDAIARVAEGYDGILPLDVDDLKLLPGLAVARFVLSVSFAAKRAAERPDDEYASVTAEPAWETIAALESRGFESCATHISEFVHDRRASRSSS